MVKYLQATKVLLSLSPLVHLLVIEERHQAMKVQNLLKIKEEFGYKSLARKHDVQVESLIAEHERQQKAYRDEVDKIGFEAKKQISEA
ncbi:hypothetical protein L6452_27423 [Arctium lappa]|uniref:Uncharacterized protein n=1 Tax=Arctium lappa TaxID=4217 RepID=A0ACB8ZW32_ARCLA|nr:hypothetical protein L6452_27423 [Arctium lappa]